MRARHLVLPFLIASTLSQAAPSPKGQEEIVVFGINDFHGALAGIEEKSAEPQGTKSTAYRVGGADMIAAHVKALRSEYGSRLLVLDAGDQFQGTLESNSKKGAPVVEFFNRLGVSAATIGNHEFDFGPEHAKGPGANDPVSALKARLKEAKYPYVVANIYDRKTGKRAALPNTRPRLIVKAGNVKVGIIGLVTEATPVTTRKDFVEGLEFKSLKDETFTQAKALRKEGAQVILLLAHAGTHCMDGPKDRIDKAGIHTALSEQGACRDDEEIAQVIRALPAGTIDAVVGGHIHTIVHHWIAGVPVVQAMRSGMYFNLLKLKYDHETRKVLGDATEIEGPVPVCEKVFANQGDCNGKADAPANGRGELVSPKFHGKEIKPDPVTVSYLKLIDQRVGKLKRRVVGYAEQSLPHPRDEESVLGNLVTDAMRSELKTDFALINRGAIRTGLESGVITYGDVYRAFPFDNFVSRLKVTGAELKSIIRVSESGKRGIFSISGLFMTLIKLGEDAPGDDLDGNGQIEHWELNRILSLSADNGPLDDVRIYTLAAPDFLVNGGDDLGWPMSRIPKERIEMVAGDNVRDTFVHYLGKQGKVNTAQKPAIDPAKPRIKQISEVASLQSRKTGL